MNLDIADNPEDSKLVGISYKNSFIFLTALFSAIRLPTDVTPFVLTIHRT
ncbi:hypothetical protein P7M46_11080 [Bisgaard Taxon 10/6]|nr:hypothetical protein [Exercitatus varius]QOF67734.1 hypothetical protein IFE17_11550 [Actinobacillus sp. GY-402]MDG2916148.1 hypothetical protein [Exercitatus varius]MDG2918540.1 hypothetical protein [Exercitatus varius]MDG2956920.1 hypothetical protein [Exercitatus varius]MDG2963119.1 hypothetical protein [Exercitatus varius]